MAFTIHHEGDRRVITIDGLELYDATSAVKPAKVFATEAGVPYVNREALGCGNALDLRRTISLDLQPIRNWQAWIFAYLVSMGFKA